MPEVLGWVPQISAGALLAVVVLWILSGRLIPRSIHEEVRRDRDAYRQSADTSLASATKTADSVERLTTAVGQLTAAVEKQATTQQEMFRLLRSLVPAGPDERAPVP